MALSLEPETPADAPSPSSAPPRPAPSRPPFVSGRGVLAALLTLAGGMHLAVATGRSGTWTVEGFALAVIGVAQLVLAAAAVWSRQSWSLWTIAAMTTVVSGAWLVTRTAGYPFGPYDGLVPNPTAYELVLVSAQLVAAAIAGIGLLTAGRSLGSAGIRFEVLAPVAVALVAVPGLVVSASAGRASLGPLGGESHSHSSTVLTGIPVSTLTAEERATLGAELVTARSIASALPTVADARAAGWVSGGVPAAFAGYLMVSPDAPTQDEAFEVGRPLGLLYAGSDATSPVVGVEYAVWPDDGREPVGFTGADDVWHLHTGTCRVTGGDGIELLVPLDEPLTGTRCAEVGGAVELTTAWMLRAWVVPGWENPAGVFAHDHPGVS